jgi:hypothetical protein|tara:strand:- start:863 stop:1180 length:318 start_codon:yes stop_codon:yes gene_type:complete
MRKITQKIANAFLAGDSLKIKNTETDGRSVWLHGNEIARRTADGLEVTLAGWNTVTTRERVNGICELWGSNLRFVQRDFEAFTQSASNGFESWVSDSVWINAEGE